MVLSCPHREARQVCGGQRRGKGSKGRTATDACLTVVAFRAGDERCGGREPLGPLRRPGADPDDEPFRRGGLGGIRAQRDRGGDHAKDEQTEHDPGLWSHASHTLPRPKGILGQETRRDSPHNTSANQTALSTVPRLTLAHEWCVHDLVPFPIARDGSGCGGTIPCDRCTHSQLSVCTKRPGCTRSSKRDFRRRDAVTLPLAPPRRPAELGLSGPHPGATRSRPRSRCTRCAVRLRARDTTSRMRPLARTAR